MRIRRIELTNHEVLGSIEFDFTNESGEVINTIIIAGENGTGKTTVLEVIYQFCNLEPIPAHEIREFHVEFIDSEIDYLRERTGYGEVFREHGAPYKNAINFIISFQKDSNSIVVVYKNSDGEEVRVASNSLYYDGFVNRVLRGVYSTLEVNSNPNPISTISTRDIDMELTQSVRSSLHTPTEITQLLVDIKALDDADLADWVNKNPGQVPPEEKKRTRLKRFENAFNYIFPVKHFDTIKSEQGYKKVYFEENGKKISIEHLSSGEKQIVFRGGFLLKDKRENEGAIVLIDEPETSLHPNWQKRIANYFKTLITDELGKQTSQVFFATHSPYMIHNDNRTNDKVIVLKRNDIGQVYTPQRAEFSSWTMDQVVSEAFNLNEIVTSAHASRKHIVITEGKTDWKHLRRARMKLHEQGISFDERWDFLDYEDTPMGHGQLIALCEQVSKIKNDYKIICIFDRDVKDAIKKVTVQGRNYKSWGGNVYSFVIPIPEHRKETPDICIEHYYRDEEIKLSDTEGRRLYMGHEFNKLGMYLEDFNKMCAQRNKLSNAISIIDDEIYMVDNPHNNISLSKNNFAENILKGVGGYEQVGFQMFHPIFEIIEDIINEEGRSGTTN